MIQAFTETGFTADITTEDNRINTSVASSQIRFLVKFINDIDGSIAYVYPNLTLGIKPRYTSMNFIWFSTPNMFIGGINLLPAGHWKYEVYEVSWIGKVIVVGTGTAPVTEIDVLPIANTNGVVEGIVTKGILNLTEKVGTEQVQYLEHEQAASTNYVYYGAPVTSFPNVYSLGFDGVDDFVTMGDADVFTPNSSGANRGFSMSFWVKVPAIGQKIISKNYTFSAGSRRFEYKVNTDFNGKLNFNLYSQDTDANNIVLRLDTALTFDTWHHIALSWNLGITNADIIGYQDGVKYSVADGNATWGISGTFTTVTNTVNPLEMGKVDGNFGNLFLDEVAIFDNALTVLDVATIYNNGFPTDLITMPYLLGWWRNGDVLGAAVYPKITDDSTNSNDGTMTNMDSGDIVADAP